MSIAINAVVTTKTFEDAIIAAVNHDGDSDTTAAMAGNLAGTLYGVAAIPQRWLSKLEMREEITAMALEIAKIGAR